MQKALVVIKATVYEKVFLVLNNNKIITFHVMLLCCHCKDIYIMINNEQLRRRNEQTILKH